MGVEVAQGALFPGELRVFLQVPGGLEMNAAGMAHRCGERHLLRHGGVSDFVLHGAGGTERRLPRL